MARNFGHSRPCFLGQSDKFPDVPDRKEVTWVTDYQATARVFKAFCDANRLTILSLLQNGELCACKLLKALHIGQPTLSHHMKILCDAGIVTGRKEGKWTHYSINREGVEKAKKLLEDITTVNTDTSSAPPHR